MNTVDHVWSRRPVAVDVLRMQKTSAAGDSLFRPLIDPLRNFVTRVIPRSGNPVVPPPAALPPPAEAPAPKPVAHAPPPVPADAAGIAADPMPKGPTPEIVPWQAAAATEQAAKNVAAPLAGQLASVASGKSNIISPMEVSPETEALFARGDYSPITSALPTLGVDKLTPEQLAAAVRTHMSIGRTPLLAQRLAGQRVFKNPAAADDAKANIDYDAVRGVYTGRLEQFTPEERAAYHKALFPGVVGVGEEKLVGAFSPETIKAEVGKANTEFKTALKEVETNPDGTGFTDWFTESWGNVAVPAGLLLMLFGGDTGMMLGGLAVAAGGYDIYNRYNTLTKDPAAQMAISQFVKGGMSKKALADIRTNFGDRYAKSALDFMALSRYGFLSVVQGQYRDAGMKAYRTYNPGKSDKDVEDFGKEMPGATPDQNSWLQDWSGKGVKGVGDLWNQGKDWLAGTPAAAPAAPAAETK